MSGFREDVISILRDNVMLHGEAMGLILEGRSIPETAELLKDLEDRKFPVADKSDKHVFLFDYVVIHEQVLFVNSLLKAFSLTSRMGIIILSITGREQIFNTNSVSHFGNFTIHKVKYEDRAYLVLKHGADYGN